MGARLLSASQKSQHLGVLGFRLDEVVARGSVRSAGLLACSSSLLVPLQPHSLLLSLDFFSLMIYFVFLVFLAQSLLIFIVKSLTDLPLVSV